MGMQDCFYGVAVGLRLGWGLKAIDWEIACFADFAWQSGYGSAGG